MEATGCLKQEHSGINNDTSEAGDRNVPGESAWDVSSSGDKCRLSPARTTQGKTAHQEDCLTVVSNSGQPESSPKNGTGLKSPSRSSTDGSQSPIAGRRSSRSFKVVQSEEPTADSRKMVASPNCDRSIDVSPVRHSPRSKSGDSFLAQCCSRSPPVHNAVNSELSPSLRSSPKRTVTFSIEATNAADSHLICNEQDIKSVDADTNPLDDKSSSSLLKLPEGNSGKCFVTPDGSSVLGRADANSLPKTPRTRRSNLQKTASSNDTASQSLSVQNVVTEDLTPALHSRLRRRDTPTDADANLVSSGQGTVNSPLIKGDPSQKVPHARRSILRETVLSHSISCDAIASGQDAKSIDGENDPVNSQSVVVGSNFELPQKMLRTRRSSPYKTISSNTVASAPIASREDMKSIDAEKDRAADGESETSLYKQPQDIPAEVAVPLHTTKTVKKRTRPPNVRKSSGSGQPEEKRCRGRVRSLDPQPCQKPSRVGRPRRKSEAAVPTDSTQSPPAPEDCGRQLRRRRKCSSDHTQLAPGSEEITSAEPKDKSSLSRQSGEELSVKAEQGETDSNTVASDEVRTVRVSQ